MFPSPKSCAGQTVEAISLGLAASSLMAIAALLSLFIARFRPEFRFKCVAAVVFTFARFAFFAVVILPANADQCAVMVQPRNRRNKRKDDSGAGSYADEFGV